MNSTRRRLVAGEEVIKVQVETSEFGKHAGDAIARLFVLRRMLEVATENGFEITEGPEVTEIHMPQSPGDPAWMVATAIARSR